MLGFKDEYQQQVIANARAFARALNVNKVSVQGDASVGFTQTHQVIVRAGHAKGPEVAHRLELNNVVANYQALPTDNSFSDASGIRLGVQEMTRFGMKEDDFERLAVLMSDIIIRDADRTDEVVSLRREFLEMGYCFSGSRAESTIATLQDAFLRG